MLNAIKTKKIAMDLPNFNLNLGRFKTLSKGEKEMIMEGRSAENTVKATRLWVDCFREYLAEKNLPAIEDILDVDLPKVLFNFYTEVKKRTKHQERILRRTNQMYQRLRNSVKTLMNIKIHPSSACELPSTDISLRKEVSTLSPTRGFCKQMKCLEG